MSRQHIADALKRLRERAGLTADQVGEKVGKSGKTVNAWENNRGQPDAEMLMQLCDIYNVSDILSEFREVQPFPSITLTPHETTVINAYRAKPEMQTAVDTLLGVKEEQEKMIRIPMAAYGGDGVIIKEVSQSQYEKSNKLLDEIIEKQKRRK